MHGTLEDFLDRLETVAGGFSLMPYVRDVKRFLSQWMDVLPLPGAGEKRRELHRLLHCRLPYEHPLAAMTADSADKGMKG